MTNISNLHSHTEEAGGWEASVPLNTTYQLCCDGQTMKVAVEFFEFFIGRELHRSVAGTKQPGHVPLGQRESSDRNISKVDEKSYAFH